MSEVQDRYNYPSFFPEYFMPMINFHNSPPVGSSAPDFPLWNLDKSETSLKAILSSHLYTIVEFGSFTWPYCGMAAPSMNAIAEKYGSQDVGSIFLYTNEAHPGENMPHLTSMEQKFRHAQLLRDELGVTRPILLDSLDGACHRAYGSNPNMTWIFSRSGQILYKSDWTDAHSVDSAIAYYLDVLTRRRAGERMTTFLVERVDFRENDREKFDKGLARNGPKAVTEFQEAFPH